MDFKTYLSDIEKTFLQGNATEHSFRGFLQTLLADAFPLLQITNEPKRVKAGAPDYVICQNDIPIGYMPAKIYQ